MDSFTTQQESPINEFLSANEVVDVTHMQTHHFAIVAGIQDLNQVLYWIQK